MTPSAKRADGGRVTRWTRELIITKIREWHDRYGEPPCSADWNPSLARWRAQEWRAARYREGVWPSTNAAKRPFDGSFDAAVRAAGLEPHKPGPRRRLPGEARPEV
ncbi:MAG: Homing endonuclease associated repeat, partial [Solirubrobacteraceae bacterium]|nr:Homing endonuclease associated repeat [Solirubrobacteraceae bacterium]